MSLTRWLLAVPALIGAAVVVMPAGVATRSESAAQVGKQPKAGMEDEIIQEFPGVEGQKTAWKVRYVTAQQVNGQTFPMMMITGAWFKTAPNEEWFSVLGEVRLSEIFVPYNGSPKPKDPKNVPNPTRIYDIGNRGSHSLLKHTQADAGAHGELLNGGLVVKEVRDTGILWKYYNQVRRGQELVLWATMSASNYNYLMEYAFRCDGSVQCKLGSTGKNFGNHELMGHMHHGCWRIDLNVGEKDHNSVAVVSHHELAENKGRADDKVTQLTTECGVDWNADEFTRLRVESRMKNSQGKQISYEMIPLRFGSPRHHGPGEDFTAHDFWVTPYKVDELYYCLVHKFAAQGRPVQDTNVVVWYMSPVYHLPRDEDGVFINPQGRPQVRGVAMTSWCGVEMRPRNLFDKSPLYP